MTCLTPKQIDTHVGTRLRALRTTRGLTHATLAVHLGLSFQQVQKYETGANRISASKLYQLAQILGVTPNAFFDGLGNSGRVQAATDVSLKSAQTAQLLENIQGKDVRGAMRVIAKALAGLEPRPIRRPPSV